MVQIARGTTVKALLLGLAAIPGLAQAQARECVVPRTVPTPRAEGPTADQPRRLRPIGGYTLALTWSPEYCRGKARQPASAFQCGGRNRFGFTLHGLWPDGRDKEWPQYCAPAAVLPAATIARNLCATPSAQLLQHEYAKHGTCMGIAPDRYFAQARQLWDPLRFPDMDALSRRSVTAGGIATAFARANPGWRADMLRVTATKNGWLDELWLCLDTRFRPTRCPAHQGGVAASRAVKIWRGGRSRTDAS